MIWLVQLGKYLLETAIGSGTSLAILEALIGREHAVSIAKNKATVVWHDALNFLALVSVNISVELATVLAHNDVTSLRAHHDSSGILHPSMANVVQGTLFRVVHMAIVHVVQLTVVNNKFCVHYFEVFVSAGASDNNGVGVIGIERALEGHVWCLGERETDVNHGLNL